MTLTKQQLAEFKWLRRAFRRIDDANGPLSGPASWALTLSAAEHAIRAADSNISPAYLAAWELPR